MSIYDAINKEISELGDDLRPIQKYLSDLSCNGFFESHHSRGEIKVVANQIIGLLEHLEEKDEN